MTFRNIINDVPIYKTPSDLPSPANIPGQAVSTENGNFYVSDGTVWNQIGSGGGNASWGSITGTLSNQTDLQNALDARIPYSGATAHVDLNAKNLTNVAAFSASSATLTSLTSGSVLFAGTGGAVSQSNSNFFWNNSNSRLGLGTTTPARILSIEGTLGLVTENFGLVVRNTNSAGLTELAYNNDTVTAGGAFVLGYGGSTHSSLANTAYLINRRNAPITFSTNNAERMRIAADGNVGIGTNNPQTNFVLNGTANSAQICLSINNQAANGYSVFRIGTEAANPIGLGLHFFNASWGGNSNSAYSPNTACLSAFGSGGMVVHTNANAPIRFFTGGNAFGSLRAIITGSGLFGIGTSFDSPAVRLHVVDGGGGAQARFAFDASNYLGIQVNNTGVTGLNAVGSSAQVNLRTNSNNIIEANNTVINLNRNVVAVGSNITAQGYVDSVGAYRANGTAGYSGTVTISGTTITVTGGIITNIA
jgi:hypothetical protein